MDRETYEVAREELKTAQRTARNAMDKLEARWIESGGFSDMVGKYYKIADADFAEFICITELDESSHIHAKGWGFELSYEKGELYYASFDGIRHLYANQSFGDEITAEEFWAMWDDSISSLIGRLKGETNEQGT